MTGITYFANTEIRRRVYVCRVYAREYIATGGYHEYLAEEFEDDSYDRVQWGANDSLHEIRGAHHAIITERIEYVWNEIQFNQIIIMMAERVDP